MTRCWPRCATAGSRALFANVAYGVGGAAIVGAAVLWFTGAPSKADPEILALVRAVSEQKEAEVLG